MTTYFKVPNKIMLTSKMIHSNSWNKINDKLYYFEMVTICLYIERLDLHNMEIMYMVLDQHNMVTIFMVVGNKSLW